MEGAGSGGLEVPSRWVLQLLSVFLSHVADESLSMAGLSLFATKPVELG